MHGAAGMAPPLNMPAGLWLRAAVRCSRTAHTIERLTATFTPQTKELSMTMIMRILTNPKEIEDARRTARAEYERDIIQMYGYMIFSEEYLDRLWPLTEG